MDRQFRGNYTLHVPWTAGMNRRLPVVRMTSWPAVIPQLLAMGAAVAIGWFATRRPLGAASGMMVYLAYSVSSRRLIPRDHVRGMRLIQRQQFDEAIRAFEQSYAFFSRQLWLDRYRSITMMSPAAMSYREMALVNIAFAYAQLGDGEQAKEYYRRAGDEFDSPIATAALALIASVEEGSRNSR